MCWDHCVPWSILWTLRRIKPLLLGEKSSFNLDFCLGYAITVSAGLLSYPIDNIRRRMMTSGQAVKYKGSINYTMQIFKHEDFMALMKGAGANILRGMAGGGVLAGFDKFKEMYVYLKVWEQVTNLLQT